MYRFSWFGVVALLSGCGVWQLAYSQAAESPPRAACVVLADQRTAEPVTAIAAEYQRRTDVSVTVQALAAADLEVRLKNKTCKADVVVGMGTKNAEATAVGSKAQTGRKLIDHSVPSFCQRHSTVPHFPPVSTIQIWEAECVESSTSQRVGFAGISPPQLLQVARQETAEVRPAFQS
jgi:hypothetical protein